MEIMKEMTRVTLVMMAQATNTSQGSISMCLVVAIPARRKMQEKM